MHHGGPVGNCGRGRHRKWCRELLRIEHCEIQLSSQICKTCSLKGWKHLDEAEDQIHFLLILLSGFSFEHRWFLITSPSSILVKLILIMWKDSSLVNASAQSRSPTSSGFSENSSSFTEESVRRLFEALRESGRSHFFRSLQKKASKQTNVTC